MRALTFFDFLIVTRTIPETGLRPCFKSAFFVFFSDLDPAPPSPPSSLSSSYSILK